MSGMAVDTVVAWAVQMAGLVAASQLQGKTGVGQIAGIGLAETGPVHRKIQSGVNWGRKHTWLVGKHM